MFIKLTPFITLLAVSQVIEAQGFSVPSRKEVCSISVKGYDAYCVYPTKNSEQCEVARVAMLTKFKCEGYGNGDGCYFALAQCDQDQLQTKVDEYCATSNGTTVTFDDFVEKEGPCLSINVASRAL